MLRMLAIAPASSSLYILINCALVMNSPKYGHSIVNLSTDDMTYGPSIIAIIHFGPPKEENFYKRDQLDLCMSSP